MLAMLKRVFQILQGADKVLYQSLKASLTTESSNGEDDFAIRLVPLLHPYIQRLFVGMYGSIHVVCVYSSVCMYMYVQVRMCILWYIHVCTYVCITIAKGDYSLKSSSQLWILS